MDDLILTDEGGDSRRFSSLQVHFVPVATAILSASCVLVWIAMLASGQSALRPSIEAMVVWGAMSGPLVAFDHEDWRFFSCMFLHFGLIHLALNLWCLLAAGPAVERLYGSASFAALYLLSGVGGAVASVWWKPVIVSAGASGAIFGIIGGLLGYLAIRHRDVPAAMLKPMRSGATAFLGYNLVFGLIDPRIDTAAHLGGLATGFLSGLVMTFVSTRSVNASGRVRSIRRLLTVAVLGLGLALTARHVIAITPDRILSDPTAGPRFRDWNRFKSDWNDFIEQAGPILDQFDQVSDAIERIVKDINGGRSRRQDLVNAVEQQVVIHHRIFIASIPARNDELRQLRDEIDVARKHQRDAVNVLHSFIPPESPDSYDAERRSAAIRYYERTQKAYSDSIRKINELRVAYFRAHDLK